MAKQTPATKPKASKTKTSRWTVQRILPYILIIGGIIGLICSFIISYDKERLLTDPSFKPSCDLNPIISCGSVMSSPQGHIFGFPNPWIGLASFAILICVGMSLLAGAAFKRWFWLTLQAGTLFGLGMVHWLMFQTLYRINALCPYCMVVWVVTITTFWYVLLHNIDSKRIPIPAGKASSVYAFVRRHHLDILITWFLIIAAVILKHFWYYYGHYLT